MSKYDPKEIESKWPASAKATAGKQKYNPAKIEKKWQAFWQKNKTFEVKENFKHAEKKFYALIEFPYPSAEGLHVGHPRPFTAMDVIARKRRMEGYNVLYPIGFDAFGLPTENFAIKTGRPPAEVTKENIVNFTRQLKALGYSFDWSRQVNTSDPAYYKWTQWMFLQFFKHGLAYKTNQPINWCPKDKIGLANEEVVNGCCERCGTPVEKRNKDQWMLAITKYADKLLEGLKEVDYITPARVQQENWIGRSEGAEVEFRIKNEELRIKVFTTRPDTIFGATFLAISAEVAKKWVEAGWEANADIKKYVEQTLDEQTASSREEKAKTGIDTGVKAINPVNNEAIPVWITNYVLGDVGTGAIMAVPAHDRRDFEFAKKYNLPIRVVIRGSVHESGLKKINGILKGDINEGFDRILSTEEMQSYIEKTGAASLEDGLVCNSDFLNNLAIKEAKEKIIAWLEEKKLGKRQVTYKLRDWVFSRQHYWGEPIPLVYCKSCAGWIPLPESELPLKLPKVEKYQPTDTGESPLSAMTDWVNTKCPRCGGAAKRETDTMPNWAGSSWYFLRYCDPDNDKEFASMKKLEYWMGPNEKGLAPPLARGGVDWYNGGMEHTVLHLLYSRFWNQFLYDIGVVPTREPYKKRTSHGMILGPDGEKMSKSRGNVINPDEMIEKFGTDAFRLYIMFMGPFDQAVMWDTNGLVGVRRFLEKVWALQEKVRETSANQTSDFSHDRTGVRSPKSEVQILLHQTIKKVSDDIEAMRFNTAIAKMMELVNEMSRQETLLSTHYSLLIQLLSPFAPHLCEELWEKFGDGKPLAFSAWPKYDPALAKEETITVAVQVNGKVRDELTVDAEIGEEEIKKLALASEKIQKWLEGKKPKKTIYVKGRLVSIVI